MEGTCVSDASRLSAQNKNGIWTQRIKIFGEAYETI
jgi:hypothetical protein